MTARSTTTERLLTVQAVLLSQDHGGVAIEKTATTIVVDGEEMLLEMFSDITRRKAAEESLRGSKGRFRAIFEMAHGGVLTIPIMGILADTKSKVMIIDLTAVRSIDSAVANRLLKTVAAAQLLGAECILTGIAYAMLRVSVSEGSRGTGGLHR